ncbi:MAG: hypothetical protein LBR82_07430 [Desulfovibrio sp.]|nr:hypothetical protein [Desulfovibrio sp.]
MKKLGVLCMVLLLGISAGGCSWMGRTAGKAQAKVERKAHDLERGYHQGYEEEQVKKRSPKTSGDTGQSSEATSYSGMNQHPPQTAPNSAGQKTDAASERQPAE